jgi:maleate cis-trans isomerase
MDQLQWTAKIGLVVVSSSTVCEGRYPRVAPREVGFFTSRMLLSGGGLKGLEAMEGNAARAMEELASVPVDVIAYCCTVSGALRGVEGDRAFCQDMAQRWGIPVTSTMLAATEAMHHLGLRRVVVTSPYPDSHHEAERDYLEQTGIKALAMQGMGLEQGQEFARVTPEEILQFSLDAWDDAADGLFISCMNFDALPAVQALEDQIGKPVVTSHSATLWRALALADIREPILGYGRLLAQSRDVAQADG